MPPCAPAYMHARSFCVGLGLLCRRQFITMTDAKLMHGWMDGWVDGFD
eukprot:CAMPEP_0167820152 /NCGR_PEP_ID=MMETSP0112_2-20121227/5900_1 /TAXON_ID=91324 /ORGANISM="Lotharella globosa, Strain CCCM811" /LENGTH=47 /DNA_ID= /DNA_START= /DNA_END= /DNA_ORIENTATION=